MSSTSNFLISYLTLSEIVNSHWKFSNDNGYLGYMTLKHDGTVSEYNNYNERFWTFDGRYLTLLNGSKKPTCKFIFAFRDYYGKWRLNGRFLIGNTIGWEHYLEQ